LQGTREQHNPAREGDVEHLTRQVLLGDQRAMYAVYATVSGC
jgi:hypothetical protein